MVYLKMVGILARHLFIIAMTDKRLAISVYLLGFYFLYFEDK